MSPALALEPPASCGGTLLQLQVEQSGRAAFDRFRFDLGLEAEAASKAEAMALLNSRLTDLRTALRPLVSGELTIPAPTTYRSGGGTGPGSTPVREHASTSVGGVVGKATYDALIQTSARLPGVTLRGFTAQAAGGAERDLQAALLRQGLAEGRRQADLTALSLGLQRVRLLRIDQRGGGAPRPPCGHRAAAASFNPEEAPAPERSLTLALDYCLS
ncbi:MAG: SIMPL domain-containing protein [Cyanobacteriota bacterium]